MYKKSIYLYTFIHIYIINTYISYHNDCKHDKIQLKIEIPTYTYVVCSTTSINSKKKPRAVKELRVCHIRNKTTSIIST